ncbi:PAS domain-containing hybrid sensor histidine kinase/response regulator [Roseivirga sp. E12]|uniref:PAS domain-containing hybrid sensor histidine kinase/response regulator n=1 Tax=Roseivirga sp. E12 TaxID=2819237 RepID=UPI001ABC46CE|nr:PAS domain-containing hybrid sensor histidine kinase/response regulator [Roseivirga sp. E12]MBO3698604.1 response regulator [Roseivirga sp. E12]
MSFFIYFSLVFCLVAVGVLSYYLINYKRKYQKFQVKLIDEKRRKESITDTFELLMDHSSDFVFRYNKKGMIIYASSNVERILGFEKEDNQVHFTELLTPNPINDKIAGHMSGFFEGDQTIRTPVFVEVYDAAKQTHMLEIFEFPFSNVDAEVEYVTCVARNVTSLYKTELELKESEHQQAMILQAIPDAMFTLDRECRYIDYQVHNEDKLWYRPSDFLGKKVSEIVPGPLGKIFEDAITNAFKTGELQTLEYEFGKPGAEENFEGRIIKLDPDRVLIISRNISPQKKLEIELRKAKNAAESAAKAKSNFLATMSHEIRTPMNGVIGMTSLLAETELSEEQKDYVDTIQASGDTLLRIINDILDYSKIESGKLSFEETVFSLEKVVYDSFSLFNFEASKKELSLNSHIDENVPPFIKTDRGRLRQILLNLLSNAVKFTERGSVTLNVELESMSAKHAVICFTIKDTGIGIPQNKLGGLFQEFTQADSSHSRRFGGTGLGLAIVKRLVKLLHGKISVKSEVGVGSEFSFNTRVKLASKKNLGEAILNQTEIPNDKSDQLISNEFPLKILLAEDNSINRRLTTIFLERLGFIPDVAVDGLEVIKMVKENAYDLILLDVSMPKMDGHMAAQIIGDMGMSSPPYIIGFSANAFQEDIDLALESGMDDYLTKPIQFEVLRNKLIAAGQRRFPFVS